MFTTVSLLEAITHRYPISRHIRDTFFSQREFADAHTVQLNVRKGGRGLAPFILPLEGQVIGRRLPFVSMIVSAPTIAPARVVTLREISRPWWGETPFNYLSVEQRIANIYAQDTEDMDDEISRTEEWLCANMMFSGKVTWTVRTKTPQTIDFGFTNITAVDHPWDTADGDPLKDLQLAQQSLNEAGYAGNIAIYGTRAWNALMNNPKVKETFLWPRFGPVNSITTPENLPPGVASGPSFTNPVMSNTIYSGSYMGPDGNIHRLVPDDKVLVASSDVRNRIVYAMVTQIEQADGNWHSYSAERVPKVEVNVNKNFWMYTLTSRPVPIPTDLMSWTVLENVVSTPSGTSPEAQKAKAATP
jgi:hypothetical protein